MWSGDIQEFEFDNDIEEYFGDFSDIADVEKEASKAVSHDYLLPGVELQQSRGFGSAIYIHEGTAYSAVAAPGDELGAALLKKAQKPAPKPGSEVLARVIRVTPRHVVCDIFAFDGATVRNTCRGHIRPTDIQPIGIDKLSLLDCFRPLDIIRAQLLATGVARNFLLSTIGIDHGVIQARSATSNEVMTPICSYLLRCPKTGGLERRKVAQPRS